MRVRGAVTNGPRCGFEVKQVELASPRQHEVLVRIAASGLCGSDLNAVVSLYLDGQLLLDELITRRLELTELDEGFERMRAGAEARQVVMFS